jgi:hypothetical protein
MRLHYKNFAVTERVNGPFRLQAYNLTNTPHFANPADTNLNDGHIGLINSVLTNSWRQVELGLHFTFYLTTTPGGGEISISPPPPSTHSKGLPPNYGKTITGEFAKREAVLAKLQTGKKTRADMVGESV